MLLQGDNMMGVKRNNRATVLQLLHANGSMSRKRLAESMNLTAAAITKIVAELQAEGLVREGNAVVTGSAGRREVLLEINASRGVALGIHINLQRALISAVTLDGALLFCRELSLPPSAPAEPGVRLLSDTLLALVKEHGIDRDAVIGVGVAVRGRVSADYRCSEDSYGALADKGYPLCDKIEEFTGFPAVLDNNVRALHAAQLFLEREEVGRSQFFFRCEYGIGASLAIEGKIWPGVSQSSGEIGHIPVVRKGGRRCNCGRTGCLETVASPTAIRELLTESLSPEVTPVLWTLCQQKGSTEPDLSDIFAALEQGDPGVAAVVNRAAAELRSALEAVARIFDPDTIVLYGRLFEESRFLTELLEKETDLPSHVKIEKSEYNCTLEDKAACLLAVNHFFNNGGTKNA